MGARCARLATCLPALPCDPSARAATGFRDLAAAQQSRLKGCQALFSKMPFKRGTRSAARGSRDTIRAHLHNPGNQGDTIGRITVTQAKKWSLYKKTGAVSLGWRAVLSSTMRKGRTFGNRRETIVDAVEDLLERFSDIFLESKKNVLRQDARALQVRRGRQLPSGGIDAEAVSQAADGSARQAAAEGPSVQRRAVQYVHQIYGLFGDHKAMSPRFSTSRFQWQACAVRMDASYILWDAAMVETLIRTRYSSVLWDMYQQVRYPVMRVDIARVLILHAYGGLYADLDTLPNREWYSEAPLAVCSVYGPATGGGHLDSDWRQGTGPGGCHPRKHFWDMEVLVGERGSPFLLKWTEHMRKEISQRDYRTPGSAWYHRRMRYIYNTTGPYSMRRFLLLPENASLRDRMLLVKMNWFKDAPLLTAADRPQFDVLTTESNSYFTDQHEIRVPVGTVNVDLPAEPRRLPTIGKSPVHVSKRPDQVCADPSQRASIHELTQQIQEMPAQKDEGDTAWRERQAGLQAECDRQADYIDRLQTHYDRQSECIDRLRKFFKVHQNCVSEKNTLEDMPDDLRQWITPHEHPHCHGDTSGAKRPRKASPRRHCSDTTTTPTRSETSASSSPQQRRTRA